MNPLNSLYCRTFQTAFRVALPVLPYREPQTVGSTYDIPNIIKKEGVRKPLIVTDPNLRNMCLVELVTKPLDGAGIPYAIYSDTQANPTVANAHEAFDTFIKQGCDCIIAFGGGSSMDCAKVCGALVAKPGKSVEKMRGILKVLKRTPLMIAVPTTAGTGSETTVAAVITDPKTHHKYPINDFCLIPDYAVLDPHTTIGLPPSITAQTGIDALVHATEAYIGRSTTAQTRAWAEEAVRLIKQFLKRSYDNGQDIEARKRMLRASFLAGAAFSMSYVGYVHGVAHSLGGKYGTPHGLANAVLAPYVLDVYDYSAHKRLGRLARETGIAPQEATDSQAAHMYIEWFRNLNKELGIPDKLPEIKAEDIPDLAKKAAQESNPLYPVPKLMSDFELQQIYRLAMADDNGGEGEEKAGAADDLSTAPIAPTPDEAISQIMARQRAYFATGKTIPVEARMRALRRLRKSIKAHEAEIEFALREDLGKSFFEGYMCEVGLTLSELNYQLAHVSGWALPRFAPIDLVNFASVSYTIAEPYGSVLVMSPWNYPFMLAMEPMIGAVAAGNTCVVKPSAYSPATSRIIARIIGEAFEPGHVDVVLGGREENRVLLDHKFDYIFFTGSKVVGHQVLEKASRHLTPATLELGGKSPCVIAADADLEVAAARVAFGKWLNLGQTCVAPDYVLVDKRVEAKFAELVIIKACEMFGADAFANPDYGHIVNKKHFDRLSGLIDPAKVVFGGECREETLQIDPTVMMGVTADDAVMQEEIFGPILPIIGVDTMDDAIAFIKEREKPLACYLFTNDPCLQDIFKRYVSFGGGCINDTIVHMATSEVPFGGVGASGMGQYHGYESFRTFSHTKSMLKKAPFPDLPLRYQPYNAFKLALIKLFMH